MFNIPPTLEIMFNKLKIISGKLTIMFSLIIKVMNNTPYIN